MIPSESLAALVMEMMRSAMRPERTFGRNGANGADSAVSRDARTWEISRRNFPRWSQEAPACFLRTTCAFADPTRSVMQEVMKIPRDDEVEQREVAFALMERGATWPAGLSSLLAGESESIVVVQGAAETASDFAARALQRLRKLRKAGRAIRNAVLVAGGAIGDEIGSARRSVAKAVVSMTPSRREQQLVLAGGERLSDEGRDDLADLATALSQRLGERGPSVHLMFGAERLAAL